MNRSHPTDPTGAMFQPDLLLPSQMAGAAPPDDPCRRLVLAVLERALLDAMGRTNRPTECDEARAWLASDDETPFSFRWVTSQLGIDGDWLRGRILRRTPRIETSAPVPAAGPGAQQADGRNAA